MIPKFLMLMNWQIDARLKAISKSEIHPINTNLGSIIAIDNPAYRFDESFMLSCALNDSCIKKLKKEIKLSALCLDRICLTFGFKGFLIIEVECSYLSDIQSNSDITSISYAVETDAEQIALKLSETEIIDWLYQEIILKADKYLDFNSLFYFSQHVNLIELSKRHSSSIPKTNDRFIYNFHTFVTNKDIVEKFLEAKVYNRNPIKYKERDSWQRFAQHLWLVNEQPSLTEMRELSYTSVFSAWEVLIFDVAVLEYNDAMSQIISRHHLKEETPYEMINHDNHLIQEIGILLRDSTTEQIDLTQRCRSEYLYDTRKELFLEGKEALKIASEGQHSEGQSKYSRTMELILSILTAMSIYSVVCDGFTLLTTNSDEITFHLLSSILFVFATIIMLAIFLISKKK